MVPIYEHDHAQICLTWGLHNVSMLMYNLGIVCSLSVHGGACGWKWGIPWHLRKWYLALSFLQSLEKHFAFHLSFTANQCCGVKEVVPFISPSLCCISFWPQCIIIQYILVISFLYLLDYVQENKCKILKHFLGFAIIFFNV